MNLYRPLVTLLLLISAACEIKLAHVCPSFLQFTLHLVAVKMYPLWKTRGTFTKAFSFQNSPRHEISYGNYFPRENMTFFTIINKAPFDSFIMLDSEQNVLTWIASNVCTCWSESKHFAVHLSDIKQHLPMGLWYLMRVVVWMFCMYISLVDWSACL